VVALSGWATLGYVLAVRPSSFGAMWVVAYRLFFLLLASVGAAWVAWREAAHGREVTRLARHSHAGHVTVALERSDAAVTCSVKDDGVGFDATCNGRPSGFGLEHMRERAGELGGTLDICSNASGGTTVRFSLPLRATARPPDGTP
jgi:hypothetical protein